ncbi:hypothetical protein HanRHA438_Chr06g0284051 [Helianthus annuus]|uniref:uncharacterized protein LOC118479470 n=1 Tax=Helianthus annuus TaxID=4232 RepID=UPI001652E685|nr:uncharacterized protein LOC118479470 [Helianthus annuus]KAJ0561651.1 hypothetical protein HanHA300_Chr06g0225421 [Helianthus annuus]KAJ0568382.1 hypothetical protein HanIR_Chr06g0295611 [Helianthus annuus]KAJ0574715.1 hypothetical protein HanHA89_Chr06g0241371 [Helianthus annuus]KAJ0739046.1 hypothetical protein HanLR1_Chr06g0225281 [Helianthus annuus]KAJ0741909.1 hypothetical protein HanOQP8_Chr06g0233501 [Helianthus annuus]
MQPVQGPGSEGFHPGVRSSGSAGSKGPGSGAAPTSVHVEKTEKDPDPKKLILKNASKRSREETKSEAYPAAKKVAGSKLIGKKGSLRTHYSEVLPGVITKRPVARPKTTVSPPKTAAGEKDVEASKAGKQPIDTTSEVVEIPEVVKTAGFEQPIFERMDTEARVENPIVQ